MKKFVVRVLIVAAALLITGCDQLRSFGDPFVIEQGPFFGHNTTADQIEFRVNDQPFLFVGNEHRAFDVRLQIAKDPSGSLNPTGPGSSPAEKRIDVIVFARNLTRGTTTREKPCPAGAKILTSLTYRITGSQEELVCSAATPTNR